MSILFEPTLQLSQVHLSPHVRFVIANSVTMSIKSQNGYKQYNLRVVECRLAIALLCKAKGIDRK